MNFFEALHPALIGLFATSLAAATADMLFGERDYGVRLACGLSMALCLARIAGDMLG